MASTDIFILSSPPPPRQFATFNMSSSPLPSLADLADIRQKNIPVLRTGSRATPIPQFASASFTSAASLLKNDNGEALKDASKSAKAKPTQKATKRTGEGERKPKKATSKKVDEDKEVQVKVAKPRKVATKKTDEVDGEKEPKKQSKPRAKKLTQSIDVKEKPAHKPKAKKADGESQSKLPTGKVTKNSNGSKNTSKSKKRSIDLLDDYGLLKAPERRTDWTPPKPSGNSAAITLFPIVSRSSGSTDLFSTFGFTKTESVGEKKVLDGQGTRKRKLIELVETNISSAAAAPKAKAPKKKARTITEQATSAYAEEEESPEKAPLLQYFSLTTDGFKIPPKPRSKSPIKGAKVKKGTAAAPILLSPESALKQVGNQDFVFGTSSQLAREESPTFFRDIHEAMRASNIVADDPFDDPFADSPAPVGRGNAVLATKRNLWSAAARDAGGELMDAEIVDLADSPAFSIKPKPALIPTTSAEKDVEVWHDVEELTKTPSSDALPKVGPVEAAIRAELLSSPVCSRTVDGSPAKTSKASESPLKVRKSPTKPKVQPLKSNNVEMPDFSSHTTAQLAKEIASYRFKPVKSRDAMITLLEKCWEGKQRIALTSLDTNFAPAAPAESSKTSAQKQSQSSPKRPRGRPRKDSTASPPKAKVKSNVSRPKITDTVEYMEMDSDTPLSQIRTPKKSKKKGKKSIEEEIYDSDITQTPSPPRRHPSQIGTPPLPLRLSTSTDTKASPDLSPASSQRILFNHITNAVTSATPSKDPKNPSWHEKILLYDPIVLEDLTVWLNTGALQKAGWNGEVEPKVVKKWCESKSICCLWKENLRGGARSRY
jgi:hypothetical protein